jgi:hypothetical protein
VNTQLFASKTLVIACGLHQPMSQQLTTSLSVAVAVAEQAELALDHVIFKTTPHMFGLVAVELVELAVRFSLEPLNQLQVIKFRFQ